MKNIFYVLILLLFLACKENTKEVLSVPTIKLVNGSSIDYFVSFPDTVFVKEVYKGKVYYKSDLDTITTSFDDTEKERYTILYLKLLPKYVYDDFEFENFKKNC